MDDLSGPDTSGVDLLYTEQEPERSAGMVSVHVMTNVHQGEDCDTMIVTRAGLVTDLPGRGLSNYRKQSDSSFRLSRAHARSGTGTDRQIDRHRQTDRQVQTDKHGLGQVQTDR